MIIAALLGNPNVGKTTIFNSLTGSNQYVGNWAGVTVEKKEGFIKGNIKLVDLPGIYAMDTYSNEEKVSKEFLESGSVDVIVNIVDASNLARNLYLTFQLMQFNIPIILVLNMADVAKNNGLVFDIDKLSKLLKVSIIEVVASKKNGIDKIIEILQKGNFLKDAIDNDYHSLNEAEVYLKIEGILGKVLKKSDVRINFITEKIDNLVLNKYLSYPIFLFIIFLIFNFTFSWVGKPLSTLFTYGMNLYIFKGAESLLKSSSPWFSSLIVKGMLGGVGSVIVFLPIILALFLGVSFLEDSGYMARAALIMDKFMRKMGLSGKAFIPMMVGFGCSVPAVMSARTLESEKDRKLTALLIPLMSCNARLPVYALFASAFFPGYESYIILSLYALGIVLAFLIGIIFKRTIFKKQEEPFLIELPPYKLPGIKNLLLHTWDKGKGFLKKAGTIIFSVSVIVWFLSNFNFSGMTDINSSLLASLGKLITPFFIPLGFGNWQNSVSLISGLMAKEVIVGTMGVIYGSNLTSVLPNFFNPLAAYSFLVFVLLYTPCISLIATMKKEYGNKMAIFSVAYQLVLAWIVSFLIYNIGSLFVR